MIVFPVSAFTDNYIWTITDGGFFDCVDPGDAYPVIQWAQAQGLSLRAILLTHHHNDHIGGVSDLLHAFPDATVFGPIDTRIPLVHRGVQEQDTISLGPYTYTVLFNPGHTATHISYYEAQQGWLFCGDTLFSAGCGRVFDGTMAQLHASMELFKSLPASTQVFCGHEYTQNNLRFAQTVEPNNKEISSYMQKIKGCTLPSTIAQELLINPFFRTNEPAVQQYALQHGANNTDSLAVFAVLREQKNQF